MWLDAIESKFSKPDDPFDIENEWSKMRSELNQRIHKKNKEDKGVNESNVISRRSKRVSERSLNDKLNSKKESE